MVNVTVRIESETSPLPTPTQNLWFLTDRDIYFYRVGTPGGLDRVRVSSCLDETKNTRLLSYVKNTVLSLVIVVSLVVEKIHLKTLYLQTLGSMSPNLKVLENVVISRLLPVTPLR